MFKNPTIEPAFKAIIRLLAFLAVCPVQGLISISVSIIPCLFSTNTTVLLYGHCLLLDVQTNTVIQRD